MYDYEKMKIFEVISLLITVILMILTVGLKIFDFQPVRHIILCNFILLGLTITMIFDAILKSWKLLFQHVGLYAIWFLALLFNLLIHI